MWKPNEYSLNVTELMSHGLKRLGHKRVKIQMDKEHTVESVMRTLEGVDVAIIPASDLCHPRKPNFSTQSFMEALNQAKCKVVIDLNDEPRIHPDLEEIVFPHYRRMVWPGSDKYLHKWTRCERIIHEPIVGEHYCYHRDPQKKKYDVIFNGSMYGFRVDFIKALSTRLGPDVNFKICSKQVNGKGIDPRHWFGNGMHFLTHEQLNDVYNQAKILLSFGIYADGMNHYSEAQLQEINKSQLEVDIEGNPQLKERNAGYPCRIFSYLGSGGFTLADRRDEQDRFFKDGEEAVSYNSVDECAAKIKHFLVFEKERERIAEAGYERYLAEHIIEKKMERVMAAVLE